MSVEPVPTSPLDRRHLLRGGALLAGAAGATVAGALISTPAAHAADGDTVKVGTTNSGSSSTTLALAPGGADPTLSLRNDDGPALRLEPVSGSAGGALEVGDIVMTDFGPNIGVDYGDGAESDILATGGDLDSIPTAVALDPKRLLDTRTSGGRRGIVNRSSAGAVNSAGKLVGGQWIDVAVASATDDLVLSAVFANVAATSPEKNGFLVVYAATDDRPNVSTLNIQAGTSIANLAFVGLGEYQDDYVVRIYSSTTTHLQLDLAGAIVGDAPPIAVAANNKASRRVQRQAKRLVRLRRSLERS